MPLEQLNLKLSPEVLADWRSRASAEGCSVRDWLLVITGSQARPKADLEARVEALENALAALQARRSPAPAAPPRLLPCTQKPAWPLLPVLSHRGSWPSF